MAARKSLAFRTGFAIRRGVVHLEMKSPVPGDKADRFQGSLRHYHRRGASTQDQWDEWAGVKTNAKAKWLRILRVSSVVLAFAGLIAIIVGLIIELR